MKIYPEILIEIKKEDWEVYFTTFFRKKRLGKWYLCKVESIYALDHEIDVDTNFSPIIQAFHAKCYKAITFGKTGIDYTVFRKDVHQESEKERIGDPLIDLNYTIK